MSPGDRVSVTVRGERVGATVVDPVSALGNVTVRLDTPVTFGSRIVDDLGRELAVAQVTRARDDVEAA